MKKSLFALALVAASLSAAAQTKSAPVAPATAAAAPASYAELLDQAEAALTQARQRKGDESELLTLQAYIYQARLGVSPMLRSMKYSRMVTEAVAQAKALNPANPRAYLVGANNVYYTPSVFGGGAEAAKPLYEEAKAKYAAFQPASPLAPNWGQSQLLGRLKKYEVASQAVK